MPTDVWLGEEEGNFLLAPRVPQLGGRFGAKVCGHWLDKRHGKETVFCKSAPIALTAIRLLVERSRRESLGV